MMALKTGRQTTRARPNKWACPKLRQALALDANMSSVVRIPRGVSAEISSLARSSETRARLCCLQHYTLRFAVEVPGAWFHFRRPSPRSVGSFRLVGPRRAKWKSFVTIGNAWKQNILRFERFPGRGSEPEDSPVETRPKRGVRQLPPSRIHPKTTWVWVFGLS